MTCRIVIFVFLFTLVAGRRFYCNYENAVNSFKRPTYDFSVRILDRVAQQTKHHFVFSPLSTWLQLMSLAEGARGLTKNEIWTAIRFNRVQCFRRKYREILNLMDEELHFMTKRVNVIVVDKLLDVKESFENEVMKSNNTKILTLNFNDPVRAAEKANEALDDLNINELADRFNTDDFNLTVLLMTETAYFKSDWSTPFNPVYTSTETFYSDSKVPVGKVRLMNQIGMFNLTEVSFINATVLELPFNTNGRVSMIVFLPTGEGKMYDLIYNLKNIRLMTIFSLFKAKEMKLVRVKLPRFKTVTELENIPELVYDMGVKRMFYPELADFGGISDYKMFTSQMRQVADIEITEKGASVGFIADSLIKLDNSEDFIANRPFVYLIVDKKTETILFGGMYHDPSIY